MTIPNSKFVKLNQNSISVENHGKSPKYKFKIGHFHSKLRYWATIGYPRDSSHVVILKYGRYLEMPQNLILKMGKKGHFRKNEQKKVGISRKKARDRFKNVKRTENEYVRFWGISGKIAYALTCKILPSKAFWGISRYPP